MWTYDLNEYKLFKKNKRKSYKKHKDFLNMLINHFHFYVDI
jgi:hypothetical protein